MKICPKCQASYQDDNLNFCLEDGTVLQQAAQNPLPETVLLNQPRITAPPQQQMSQPSAPQAAWNTGQQPYSMQPPKKSSKTWIWVLLILGVLALLCGGGFVGLVFLGASQSTSNSNSSSTSPTPKTTFGNKTSSNSSTTTTSSDRTNVDKLDLSKWVRDTQIYGNTEFTDGEFIMSSRQSRYYYVLAGTEDQKSVNADCSVVARNVDNKDTNLGFGLVFHSNPTPLQQGYALLIDSKKQRYRVVHHTPGKEDNVISWTRSDSVFDGTQGNKLEIRDKGDKIEIWINDKMVNSISNQYGYPGGVVGLYVADAIKIAFKDLEIRK